MPEKDYFLILGIPRDADPGTLRAAYRALAKLHHPDHAGVGETRRFQEIEEAYRVLSDPAARREHEARLGRRAPGWRPAAPAEWCAPPAPSDLVTDRPLSVVGAAEAVHPSCAALLDRLRRNFIGAGVPKAERPEALGFEVVLTPAEAAAGGVIPVGVPVFRRCERCGGARHVWGIPCRECRGEGWAEGEATVYVRYPPFVPSGTVIEAALDDLGVGNLVLRLHLFVGG